MFKNTSCTICLSINKRTINICETDLQYVYENLANFKVSDECWMCYICHTRLRQCYQLQQLAVQTRGLIDEIFQKKVVMKLEAYESLLELSTSRTKFVSTLPHFKLESDKDTEFYYDTSVLLDENLENTNGTQIISPASSYIKQESDVKTEFRSADELERDENLENDYGVEEKKIIDTEAPFDRIGLVLPNVENDAHQKSKVLKLKMVELSQSVIEKCFRQSPTTRPITEIYLEDRGEPTWGERSTKHAKIKQEIEDKGTLEDAEQKNTSDREGKNVKNFSYKGQLLKPIGTQNVKKPFVCDICLKEFAHKARLKSHILTHTGDIISFKCDVCSKKFSQKCDLNSHILIHTGEQPFCCDICSKKFTKTSNFKQHKLIHTGEQPFCCDICPKKFTTKSNLKQHKLRHTDHQPFSCDICSKKFATKCYLKKHQMIHTGEQPFSCDICSKKFTLKSNLKQHKLSHTGEQPFCCDICSMKFRTKSNLKKHKLVHTGEQPFSCDICSKKFTTTSNLKKHKLIHTGEKPFSCNTCSKKFTQKSQLKSHMKLIHKEQ